MRFRRGKRKLPARRSFQVEALEERNLFAGLPYGALPQDTMGFMLGDVSVTVVFFESDGTTDTNKEDWTPQLIAETKQKIQEGLDWWVDTLALQTDVHSLNFLVDWTHADQPINTQYEPIDRRSQDFYLYGNEFLDFVGFETPSANPDDQFHTDIRAFNHSQRVKDCADWAFTIFVVNSDNDSDDRWNGVGSAHSRAFAHSGGRVLVTLSGRPASTAAHEVGHMAHALDEYLFGGDYRDRRGYLDIANENARNNPAPGFVHQDSIMSNEQSLANAWAQNVSSTSSLEMVGWRDSDNDDVFDILDVPHELTGTGRPNGQTYEFRGQAKVQTLFNKNSKLFEDLRWVSDMTINEIDRAEYRIDGGQWITAGDFSGPMVDLELDIPLPDLNPHTIEIRTVSFDSGTGRIVTTSPVFVGGTGGHEAISSPGIRGFVYQDSAENQVLDPEDRGVADWTVELHDENGQLLVLDKTADADGFNHNTIITSAFNGVTLTAHGSSVSSSNVKALRPGGSTSTGSGVFGSDFSSFQTSIWGENTFEMRMDFDTPVTRVTLDAVAELDDGYGRLEAYDAADNLVARYTSEMLSHGEVETMMVGRSEGDIAYAVAFGHAGTFIRLDNLQFGAEAVATTNDQGFFQFDYLDTGNYFVTPIPPLNVYESVSPGIVEVNFVVDTTAGHTDFGFRSTAQWHNLAKPVDVDNNGRVNVLDPFKVIDGIRQLGIGQLPDPGPEGPPPFYDVNANDRLDLVDAFAAIDAVRFVGDDGGQGQDNGDNGGGTNNGGGGAGEGEADVFSSQQPLDYLTSYQKPSASVATQVFAVAQLPPTAAETLEPIIAASTGDSALVNAAVADARPPIATAQPSRRDDADRKTERTPREEADQSIWTVRDLDQLAEEAREDAVDAIADDVDRAWSQPEKDEESSESELSLK